MTPRSDPRWPIGTWVRETSTGDTGTVLESYVRGQWLVLKVKWDTYRRTSVSGVYNFEKIEPR